MKIQRREFIRGVAALGMTAMLPGTINSIEDKAILVVSDDDWSLSSSLIVPKFSCYDLRSKKVHEWKGNPSILSLKSSYVSYGDAKKNDPCIFEHVWTGIVPMDRYKAAQNLILFEIENPVDWAKDLGLCHGLEPGILQCFCDCKTRAIEPGSEHFKTRFPVTIEEPKDKEAPWYDIPGICRIRLITTLVRCPDK